jgi:hypothetical protein
MTLAGFWVVAVLSKKASGFDSLSPATNIGNSLRKTSAFMMQKIEILYSRSQIQVKYY